MADASVMQRRRIVVRGVVQGVGFRPFVHRLASRHGLGGFVLNDGSGAVVEIEGDAHAVDAFTEALIEERPPHAVVHLFGASAVPARGEREFRIERSAEGHAGALVPPDIATCDDCLRELWDPGDRRQRYPFINCTHCGPRFTIVRRPP